MREDKDFPRYAFSRSIWLFFLPFLAMYILPFILYKGRMSLLIVGSGWFSGTPGEVISALGIVILWLGIAMIVILSVSSLFPKRRLIPPPSHRAKFQIFLTVLCIGDIFLLARYFIHAPGGIIQIVHHLSLFSLLGLLLGVVLWVELPKSRALKIVRILTVFQAVLILSYFLFHPFAKAMGALFVFQIILGALLIVKVRWMIVFKISGLLFLVLILAMPAKVILRGSSLYSGNIDSIVDVADQNKEISKKIDPNYDSFILSEEWIGDNAKYILVTAFSRFDQLGILIWTMVQTPSQIPFWGFKTYEPMLFLPFPRALFPEKPVERTGNLFGKTYNMISQTDHHTSMDLDVITEAWVAGGLGYVILSAIFIGVIFGLIWGWLKSGGEQWSKLYIYAPLLISLIGVRGNFSLLIGGLIYSLCLAVLFLWFTRVCWRRRRSSPVGASLMPQQS